MGSVGFFRRVRGWRIAGFRGGGLDGEPLEKAGGFEHGLVGATDAVLAGVVGGVFSREGEVRGDDVGRGLCGGGHGELADESGAGDGGGLHGVEACDDLRARHPSREGFERDVPAGADLLERQGGVGEIVDEVNLGEAGFCGWIERMAVRDHGSRIPY